MEAFLKIAGIPGDSTDDKHKGEIAVLSYSFGAHQQSSGAASAAGARTAGRVSINDMTIVHQLDKASPKLFLACCKGDHIAEATLVLHRATGDKQKFMEYKMTDLIISSIRPGGSSHGGDDYPLEEFTINFGKIELTYTATDHKGKPQGDVKSNWDLVANKGG